MINSYKVPKDQWRQWDESAQAVFNETYKSIQDVYGNFLHPLTGNISKEEHKTIAWNSAWLAADAVMNVLE